MSDWMKDSTTTDIQQAINTQAIQTALEKNTSALTDAAYQSFLTNAPIPRVYLVPVAGQVYTTGVQADLTLGAASRTFDPYNMLTTNTITIPIDGMYSFGANINFVAPAAGAAWAMQFDAITVQSKVYGAAVVLSVDIKSSPITAGATQWALSLVINKPFAQGDTFKFRMFQSSGGSIAIGAAGFTSWVGGTWSAPYNQYTTTSGGN